MYFKVIAILLVSLNVFPKSVLLAEPQCQCIQAPKGNPLVVNAQPVDQQNIGDRCMPQPECDPNRLYRYVDGRCNNAEHKTWGMSNNTIIRLLPAVYSTNPNDPPGTPRRSAVDDSTPLQNVRVISTNIFTDKSSPSPSIALSFMVMGQLLTHDVLSLKQRSSSLNGCCDHGIAIVPPETQDAGCLVIDIPKDDSFYHKFNVICNQIFRAQIPSDFGCEIAEREQANVFTSFVDASMVYGSDETTGRQLRLMKDGKLKFELTEDGRVFLPHMEDPNAFCFAPSNQGGCTLSGDFRGNEHPHLLALHVVFLRVHNKLAELLKKINADCPKWQEDEILYQETRKILIAILQHSLFGRYAEILFGPDCAESYGFSERGHKGYYSGYDRELNPGTLAEFQHVAFRAFHTLAKGEIRLYNEKREEIDSVKLSKWYNNPFFTKQPGVLDQVLIGMCTDPMESFDRFFTSEITNLQFKQLFHNKFGLDLESIDLERGRECGVSAYIDFATLAGYPMVKDFDQLKDRMDEEMIEELKKVYPTVKDIDALAGVVLERPFGNSIVGKTLHAIIGEQFRRYKFGDSFYHSFKGKGQFTPGQLATIRKSSLAFLICYGSDNIRYMQLDAYILPTTENLIECEKIIEDFLKDVVANWKVCPPHKNEEKIQVGCF